MKEKNILVLGASGYVGSQLIPQLLAQGAKVTAAARQIHYLTARLPKHDNLTLTPLDLQNEDETAKLIPHFDLIYFLVHGMAHGHDFVDYELSLANHFAAALALSTQVKHVIFLSAIQPPSGSSAHLDARFQTGEILRTTSVPITELQAGVIIGPGSAAYEIMRDFVYNLPILITPKWVDSKSNPIALENLNHYLLSLANEVPSTHQTFEVGGPDTLTYREQFAVLCQALHKPLRMWSTRLLTPSLAAHWLGIITSVPSSIGRSLLGGLEHDFIANSERILARYPQPLIRYQDAIHHAINQEGEFIRSEVWGFDPSALHRWQPSYGYYAKQAGASIKTPLSSAKLWNVIKHFGQPHEGYFFANPLWRLREWIDVLFGAGVPIRRKPEGDKFQVGDFIDSWKVIRCEENHALALLFGMKGPGLGRLELTITEHDDHQELNITAWWHPKGFWGLMYWFVMMPAHLFIFKGMVKAICKKATFKS